MVISQGGEIYMNFKAERLTKLRETLNISKAEAARRLNMSAMGYGRYENGTREPSFQTVSFIAHVFGTTTDYLYGTSDEMISNSITITYKDNPELFELVSHLNNNLKLQKHLLKYLHELNH